MMVLEQPRILRMVRHLTEGGDEQVTPPPVLHRQPSKIVGTVGLVEQSTVVEEPNHLRPLAPFKEVAQTVVFNDGHFVVKPMLNPQSHFGGAGGSGFSGRRRCCEGKGQQECYHVITIAETIL